MFKIIRLKKTSCTDVITVILLNSIHQLLIELRCLSICVRDAVVLAYLVYFSAPRLWCIECILMGEFFPISSEAMPDKSKLSFWDVLHYRLLFRVSFYILLCHLDDSIAVGGKTV